jgi:hypothetical protein
MPDYPVLQGAGQGEDARQITVEASSGGSQAS